MVKKCETVHKKKGLLGWGGEMRTVKLCKERSEVETKATRWEILDCREEMNEREAMGKAGLTRLVLQHP